MSTQVFISLLWHEILTFRDSHWHFDHIGDMSTFPSSTKIIVGPGFKENSLPGYPANPKSTLLETDYMYVLVPFASSLV